MLARPAQVDSLRGLVREAAGRARTRHLVSVPVVLLVGVLTTWNLTVSPPAWYDEGVNLQAARNLAASGRYGVSYGDDDMRLFDLQLTTGPTVIAPVAAAFKVLGVGLTQGRIVMVAYTLFAVLGLYAAGRLLYGPTTGLLAVVVLCATDQAGPAATRTVVGEIAALAYLFWGVALFAVARATGRAGVHVAAGLLFGLAVLTKGQFGLLLPVLVGAWLLTRRQPGGFPALHLVAVVAALLAPVVLWQAYQLVLLGAAGYMDHLGDQSAALSVSANAPLLSKAVSATRYLLSSQVATLGLAALAYMWLAVLGRGWRREPVEHLISPGFAAGWLAWYVGMSMGWSRYAVPLIATSSLFVALLIRDLMLRFWTPRGLSGGHGRLTLLANPTGTALVLFLAAPIVSGIALQLLALARPPEASAQKMAALIAREVDPQANTESFEWELDVLAGRTLHHPPPFVPNVPYEVPAATAYLVDGQMSKWFGVYSHELQQRTYRRIASVGVYDLYRREPALMP